MIVLSTTIADEEDILSIRDRLNELCGRGNWCCDLEDIDRVLSIRIRFNLGPVFALLDAAPFHYRIMNIYDTRLGIGYPFFDEET